MRKSFKSLFVFLTLFLISNIAFAQDDSSSLLGLPSDGGTITDTSYVYLNLLFGAVGSVLSGSGASDLLSSIFRIFNSGVLILGGLVVIYSLLVSTINTSHDGEMLGKRWNSVWIPLRTAAGFALLLPTGASGYALIQVFVMYIIVNGIGLADSVWNTTLDSLYGGSSGFATGGDGDERYSDDVFKQTNKAFENWVCAYSAATKINQDTSNGVNNSRATSYYGDNNSRLYINATGLEDGDCGYTSLETSGDNMSAMNNAINGWNNQVSAAAQLYYGDVPFGSDGTINPDDTLSDGDANNIVSKLQSAAQGYANTVSGIGGGGEDNCSSHQEDAEKLGWIFAGAYFLQITRCASPTRDVSDVDGPSTTKPSLSKSSILGSASSEVKNYYENAYDWAKDNNVSESSEISSNINPGDPGTLNNVLYTILVPGYVAWKDYLDDTFDHIDDYLAGNFSDNPIRELAKTGNDVMTAIEVAWMALAALVFTTGLVGYVDSCMNPFPWMVSIGLSAAMPFVTISAMILFPSAGLLAYYLPLIPFILYASGGVGWFLLVIEAMAAAPIMALGVLHPEGQHEVYGKAEQGIYLLINLFLRPALMVLGLAASYLMSFIAIGIVNVGFAILLDSIDLDGISNFSMMGTSILLSVYAYTALVCVQKTFGLIHMLPDRVMRWIGQQDQMAGAYGGAEDLAGYKQEAKEAASQENSAWKDASIDTAKSGQSAIGQATAQKQQEESKGTGKEQEGDGDTEAE